MKKLKHILIVLAVVTLSSDIYAGNKDRVAQAGATELLINPWTRSAGMFGVNTAGTVGVAAMRLNVGGLAFIEKTELLFSYTDWLKGSDLRVMSFGFGQRLGETGVLGISIMSLTPGDLVITDVDSPDNGTGATFKPSFSNIGLGYAKSFSNSIHAGVLIRVITHSIFNASAGGVAFDTGIQYVTGPKENVRFGIALRNVGTPMKYSGDGIEHPVIIDSAYPLTLNNRTEKFELPSLLNIGGAYDILFGKEDKHRLTLAGNFTSNSFSSDQFGGGLEYSFNEMFSLRGGYNYQEEIGNEVEGGTTFEGWSVGATIEAPLGDSGFRIGIDYAFQATKTFSGVHSFGVKISL